VVSVCRTSSRASTVLPCVLSTTRIRTNGPAGVTYAFGHRAVVLRWLGLKKRVHSAKRHVSAASTASLCRISQMSWASVCLMTLVRRRS
jgi:hypothetical protein